ncbi:uncharacterized protein G2W53_015081 [Senna tora]|uniref:Uncharacterized protein n=1 Tax=Senna tora TaxID=362788 RepID=A0A834WUC8_9FABA|nr:uncharacterized protein G2W53_015081 [Senna tora]
MKYKFFLQKKSVILFIHNIYTSRSRQEPVENPKQSRARDFPHLPPNQTLPLPRRRRLLLLHSPEALLRFLRQDLLQRDDGAKRSDATRRGDERSVRWPWILLRWLEFLPSMRLFESSVSRTTASKPSNHNYGAIIQRTSHRWTLTAFMSMF